MVRSEELRVAQITKTNAPKTSRESSQKTSG
jgi:hypothetical protein